MKILSKKIVCYDISTLIINKGYFISIILPLILSLPFNSSGQNISLKYNSVPLIDILNSIQNQTKVDVIGDLKSLEQSPKISISIKSKDLKIVLNILEEQSNFKFILEDNIIFIHPKEGSTNPLMYNNSQIKRRYIYKGTVFNEEGDPLSGVTVRTTDSRDGYTFTDQFGNFEFEISENKSLLFSIIGFQPKTLHIPTYKQNIVKMSSQKFEINPVYVNTGYTQNLWNSYTGAVKIINRSDIEKIQVSNIFQLLQCIAPSFRIEENFFHGSNPNIIPDINIRGITNVGNYVNNFPLIILDGFEISLESLYDLDIFRIQKINILKDATSTALYGSRGGNGVLIIETKESDINKLRISYNSEVFLSQADLSSFNLMNAKEKLDFEKLQGIYTIQPDNYPNQEAYFLLKNKLEKLLLNREHDVKTGVDTYWLSQPLNQKLSYFQNLRFEAGKKHFTFSIDAGIGNNYGLMEGSGRERKTSTLNLIIGSSSIWKIRSISNYNLIRSKNSPYGSFEPFTYMNPYYKIYENGDLIENYNDGDSTEWAINPLFSKKLPFKDIEKRSNILQNVILYLKLTPSLFVKSSFNYEQRWYDKFIYHSPKHLKYFNKDIKGQYHRANGNGKSFKTNFNFGYSKQGIEDKLNLNLITEYQYSNYLQEELIKQGIKHSNYIPFDYSTIEADSTKFNIDGIKSKLLSFIFTGNYTYKNKLLLDFSYRIDGSSKFGKNNPYAGFWTIGLGYDLKNDLLYESTWVNNFKISLNTGITGTDSFLANMTLNSLINPESDNYMDQLSTLYNNEGNPNLKWPIIKSSNIGLFGSFWRNKIRFSINYYQRKTKRMISLITSIPSLGIPNNMYYANIGSIRNIGIESDFIFNIFHNPQNNLSASLGLTMNSNKGKLIEISDELESLNRKNLLKDSYGNFIQNTFYKTGESVMNLKGMKSLGIDPNSGKEFFRKKNGSITDTWQESEISVIGNREPKLFGTVNLSFSYRNLSLDAYCSYNLGSDIYNYTKMNRIENINPWMNTTKDIVKSRWKNKGDIVLYKKIIRDDPTYLTDRFVENQNLFKLSSINLTYQFPSTILERYKVNNLRFQLSATDLITFSNIIMEKGIYYPFARTYNFRVLLQIN